VLAGLMGLAVLGNLFSSAEVFEVELLNRQQGSRVARAGLVQTSAGAAFTALVLLSQAPLLAFGAVQSIAVAARAVVLANYRRIGNLWKFLLEASWPTAVRLMKGGWPLLLSGLSVMIYMKSDQVMLEWLRGSEDVGQYSVAVRVAESLYFLPVVLASTFMPHIARGTGVFQSDPALRRLYQSAWLLGIGMAATSILILPALIPWIFGNQFRPAQDVLAWLGPAAFAVSTGSASGAWLNTHNHTALVAIRSVTGAVINIALNLVLIPDQGASGAAIATSASYIASVYCVGAASKPVLLNLWRTLAPI
jgi:PST family polysaccharide transporter